MNLILLEKDDFVSAAAVRLVGRRFEHVRAVHRAVPGDELVVGELGGRIGRGVVTSLDDAEVRLDVTLQRDPPTPLPLTLVVALPRPKVMARVTAAVASMGVKRLFFINAWRVEKSYWTSPRLDPRDIRENLVLGLEQGRDTILPVVEMRRFFRRFVEEELDAVAAESRRFVAHPTATLESPGGLTEAITLVVGPEGGFIDEEVGSLVRCGFTPISLGPRILRVETAIPYLIGRLTGG